MALSSRLKVLISAYACSPYQGSEPAVGWGFVSELAQRHELWVLVEEEKFREDIERYLSLNPECAKHIHFFFIRKQRNRLLRKIWPPSYYWYYRRWHEGALQLAKQLHHEVGFDLVHQLTMVGFREPGYLWQMGVPFVWGPVGGMGLFPWRFLPKVGFYGACYYLGYNMYNVFQMRFMRRSQLAAASAAGGLFFATAENASSAQDYWSACGNVIAEVGMPAMQHTEFTARENGEPLQLVWTGQHTPGKALNLALEALAELQAGMDWKLHVLGEGQQTSKWKKLAHQLGLEDRCTFHGWMLREEALSLMKRGHVMVISSLRDLTSTVTIEALALGLPIICLDHCGFSDVVDSSCGIKVAVHSPKQVTRDMGSAVTALYNDETRRRLLAQGALKRARDFSWEGKVREVEQIYRHKLEQSRHQGTTNQ